MPGANNTEEGALYEIACQSGAMAIAAGGTQAGGLVSEEDILFAIACNFRSTITALGGTPCGVGYVDQATTWQAILLYSAQLTGLTGSATNFGSMVQPLGGILCNLIQVGENTGQAPAGIGTGTYLNTLNSIACALAQIAENGFAPTPFNPLDIPDTSFWLEGDMVEGVANGSPVGSVTEEGPNAVVLTSVNGPIYRATGANGHPYFDTTDATDRYLVSDGTQDIFDFFGAAQGTIYLVAQESSVVAGGTIVDVSILGGVPRVDILNTFSGDIIFDFANFAGGRVTYTTPGGWDTDYHLLVFQRKADGTQLIISDGVEIANAPETALLTNTDPFHIAVCSYLGTGTPGFSFVGRTAAVIFNKRANSAPEIAQMSNYLQTKYATP